MGKRRTQNAQHITLNTQHTTQNVLNKQIWITDDDRAVCVSLSLLLKRAGFKTRVFHHPDDFFAALRSETPDLLLLDMNYTIDTSGKRGIATLKQIMETNPKLSVILMTGWATVQLAVGGMKLGAKDFVAKPWENKQLLDSVKTILALDNLQNKQVEKAESVSGFAHIVGESPNLMSVLQTAKSVANTNASVLIRGESGTGKELVAEAIHYESQRKDKPFVKVNLGGISESLFESEMFGHKRGAFTGADFDRKGRFEISDTGTIFLDEIGDLAPASQVKLLRVLQEQTFEVLGSSIAKKVDIRVVSATNKNLEEMVAKGQFREDLYYRINLITLQLPSLRERPTDIPLLVNHFVKNLAQIYGKEDLFVAKDARQWLQEQNFPGNIRQLKNVVERAVLVTNKKFLEIKDFQSQMQSSAPNIRGAALPKVGDISLEEMEKQMILKALNFHNFQISETARSLGITRSSLYRRMEKYNFNEE